MWEPHMKDEDEDVFADESPWQTPFRGEIKDIKSENRATLTPGPTLLLGNDMLPCGIAQEPRQFYHDMMDSDPDGKERNKDPEVGVNLSDSNKWTPEEAEVREKLRSTLKKKFQHLVEGVPNQGETRRFHEIYTELFITEGKRQLGINDEHEVRQIERASWQDAKQGRPIKCSDIFQQSKFIKTVLTKGVAGIGKTVSVQKFILDWAEGQANQDVLFIFPLPFRELNLMKEKKMSLVRLLQHLFPEVKDSRILSSSQHKVLFIFDGLDECRLPLDFQSKLKCSDVTESAPVDVLLTNLIMGKLLPSVLLWITTRPAAANQIPANYVYQVTEIRGFSDPQKEDYFRKRISDENLASRTITHLRSSRTLYIMCHIPVFCWITATVVERSVKSENLKMPRTLAQMYTYFLIIQTSIKKEKYTNVKRKETDEEMIFKLGKLAFQQLEKGNLIFYEEDLRECGIDVTEASVYSGVCTQIFREELGLYQGKVFSFVHLSIQEFLAALYVFLCFSNKRHISDQQQSSLLSALLKAKTQVDLQTAVDLALQSENGHLDLFLRFLLGLSLESNQNLLKHLVPESSSQSQSSEHIVQFIKQKIRDEHNHEDEYISDRGINLFYCLNELNHHAVVEKIDRSSGTLYVDMLLPEQWKTQRFEFKISEEQMDDFDLQKYIETPEKDQTELLSPDEVLQRLVPAVTSALLIDCSLTEKSCTALASACRSNSCSLKELDLSGNAINDAGVQYLSDLLTNTHCKLETLELRDCFLTERSCADLASAGRANCILKELNLSGNELHDAGVQHLSDLFKNPDCKVEKLVLRNCSLTEKSCAALASASRSNYCSLKELNLSGNELDDAGVQHLSDLLKNPHCKLEKLVLNKCSLTEKSCAALASADGSNSCRLKELDLSENKIHDAGVQHLSDLLKDPNCKLEILQLYNCSLTEKSCSALTSTGRSNSCSLKELNLSFNELHDAGVQHLSGLLKNPHCKLEKLVLIDCSLTEKSCPALASAGRSKSCSLKELNLSGNELRDAGVQHLSVLLENPQCKLEKLVLIKCSLTQKSCAALTSAGRSNSCCLKELDLSENKIHDAGVQHLSDFLKNPNCKLEKLELIDCSLTEKSCAALASAGRSNSCSLKELNMSLNDFHDAGVQHLRALLNDPHCKLEKLVVGDGLNRRIFQKESPAAAASTSSSHSPDAAKLQLIHNTQMLSLNTHTEDHYNASQQMTCESCAEVPDSGHWVLVKPEVSPGRSISTYSLSSPSGSYKCSESGLRWSCATPVTLHYCFTDWHLLADELPHMQYRPAGPSMDIKLISGELEEIHLPHFLCLGGSQSPLKDTVMVLHKQDCGVFIEKCELSRFHAKLVKPSFSLLGIFYSLISHIWEEREKQVEIHADVLVYRSTILPLTFRTYLLPVNASLTELVEKQEKSEGFRGFRLPRPRPVRRLQMNGFYTLKTNCESEIYPVELELTDFNFIPNFSEVSINRAGNFKIEISSSIDQTEVWQAKIVEVECWDNPQQSNTNTSTEASDSSLTPTDNLRTHVEVPSTSTAEIHSGSPNPVQPASVSASITAQTGAVAVAPSLSGNTFNGPVNFLSN